MCGIEKESSLFVWKGTRTFDTGSPIGAPAFYTFVAAPFLARAGFTKGLRSDVFQYIFYANMPSNRSEEWEFGLYVVETSSREEFFSSPGGPYVRMITREQTGTYARTWTYIVCKRCSYGGRNQLVIIS